MPCFFYLALILTFYKFCIKTIQLHQILMPALLNNRTIFNHKNHVSIADCVEPVRDYNQSFTSAQLGNRFLNVVLIVGIHACCGLIKNYDWSILHHGTCNCNALTFTATQVGTASSNDCVKAIFQ